MSKMSIDEAIIELAADAIKAGVPTDMMANKLLSFATGLTVAEKGNGVAAAELEAVAESVRSEAAADESPALVLPPLDVGKP